MPPILISAGNPSEWTGPSGNNTYLLPGRVPALIDAGVGNPEHVAAIERNLAGRDLALVLITHGHDDHVDGIPAIRRRWPGVVVRQFGVDPQPIRDREMIAAGDGTLQALHTPGHSPDHCCFTDGDDLFCGDLVRLGGTVVIPAGRGGDLVQYLASLRLVRDVRPKRLLPGHGAIIGNPDAVIEIYLRHRAEREAQIVAALHAGKNTADEIVRQIYVGLPPALFQAAVESVTAHLIKLKDEGRAEERAQGWSLSG
jgi:glyoxylase-like metal-dependent hydrolase (beta-lactamase superfamily II)